jgi:hypothetical protein
MYVAFLQGKPAQPPSKIFLIGADFERIRI